MARTPQQWLTYLWKLHQERQAAIRTQEAYYSGKHPLLFASPQFTAEFGKHFGDFCDNWCGTVVTAAEERMNVEGFLFGDTSEADQQAWDIWQYNALDLESEMLHTEALVHAEAYWLVWPGDPFPRVTAEHPSQMIAVCKASNHREIAAAAKWFKDDDGYWVAWLYLPDFVYRFRSRDPLAEGQSSVDPAQLIAEDRDDGDGPAEQRNPFGPIVPVVPAQNRPRLTAGPQSEIAHVIPLQNLVNLLWVDLMVVGENTADKQRWVTGWEPDRDENGNATAPFQRRQRLWYFPGVGEDGEAVRVGQFDAGDVSGYLRAIETVVQHIASQTRTPPHYLNPGADRLSGESIKSSESGLVSKVRRMCRTFGDAHEQMMRLCFLAMGNVEKAAFTRAETKWSDPEIHSDAQMADAMVKQKELGVPREIIWERLGYSQTEIRRMNGMAAKETVAAAAAQRALTVVPREPQSA